MEKKANKQGERKKRSQTGRLKKGVGERGMETSKVTGNQRVMEENDRTKGKQEKKRGKEGQRK